jgi:hypothetical protein
MATIFRDCGHRFCDRCVIEFTDGCRESYCSSSTLINLDAAILYEQAALCGEKIVELELEMIQKLEAITRDRKLELEQLISKHNAVTKTFYEDAKSYYEKAIDYYAQTTKRFQASQSVAEAMEDLRDLPLAAPTYNRYLADKGQFYRLSQLEKRVEAPEAEFAINFVGDKSLRSGPFKVELCVGDEQYTAHFQLTGYDNILNPHLVQKANSQHNYCRRKGMIVGVSKDERKTAFLLNPQGTHNCLIVIVDHEYNISALVCDEMVRDRFLHANGFECGVRTIMVFDKLYSLNSQNRIYVYNDIPDFSIDTFGRIPAADCHVIGGRLDGRWVELKVPR